MKHTLTEDVVLCMSFLGNALSANAFQDEVAHYSLSLANPKSVAVSPGWRACIPPPPHLPSDGHATLPLSGELELIQLTKLAEK